VGWKAYVAACRGQHPAAALCPNVLSDYGIRGNSTGAIQPTAVENQAANAHRPQKRPWTTKKARHLQAFPGVYFNLISSGRQAQQLGCLGGPGTGARNVQKWKAWKLGVCRRRKISWLINESKPPSTTPRYVKHGLRRNSNADWPTCGYPRASIVELD